MISRRILHAATVYALFILGILWWNLRGEESALQASVKEEATQAMPYPADMAARAARIPGLQLCLQAPPPSQDLLWQHSANTEEAGDSAARKGGRLRLSNAGPYPSNLLAFGSPTPQFFHHNLFRAVTLPLVTHHPLKDEPLGAVAAAWCHTGMEVWYRIHPLARYSNGRPVRAADYLLGALLQAELRCAEYDALAEHVAELRIHGEGVLSVRLRKPLPKPVRQIAALLYAAEPGFYTEFSASTYRKQYAWRVPPTTGAYTVDEARRGQYIRLKRIPRWWGSSLPGYKFRFNAATIEHHFLQDEAQVWELFLRGQLDVLQTRNVAAWNRYHKSPREGIRTSCYTVEYPMPPYGIALNSATLPAPALRQGLLHAMDMNRAIAAITQGEGERLHNFHTGYGTLCPQEGELPDFSPEKARACFARAGYTQAGQDGILRKADGTRLRVELLHPPIEKIQTLVNLLAQSAATCGAEIIPTTLSWQNSQRRQEEGTHELLYWATAATETPEPALYFSSLAPRNQSPFGLKDAIMDKLLEQYRTHPTAPHLEAIEQRIRECAIWLPGWKENRIYLLHHAQIHAPQVPGIFDVTEGHYLWVDTP